MNLMNSMTPKPENQGKESLISLIDEPHHHDTFESMIFTQLLVSDAFQLHNETSTQNKG